MDSATKILTPVIPRVACLCASGPDFYQKWHETVKAGVPVSCKHVEEIESDLFVAPAEYSSAHCVSEDLRMGGGVAVQFRERFGSVDFLLRQRARIGNVLFLKNNNRYVYYLITKKLCQHKPTYRT